MNRILLEIESKLKAQKSEQEKQQKINEKRKLNRENTRTNRLKYEEINKKREQEEKIKKFEEKKKQKEEEEIKKLKEKELKERKEKEDIKRREALLERFRIKNEEERKLKQRKKIEEEKVNENSISKEDFLNIINNINNNINKSKEQEKIKFGSELWTPDLYDNSTSDLTGAGKKIIDISEVENESSIKYKNEQIEELLNENDTLKNENNELKKIYNSLKSKDKEIKNEEIKINEEENKEIIIDKSKISKYTFYQKTTLLNDLYKINNDIKGENIELQKKIKEIDPNYDLKQLEYKVDLNDKDYIPVSDLKSEIPKVVNNIISNRNIQKEQEQNKIINEENKNSPNENSITWKNVFKLNNNNYNFFNHENQIVNCNITLDEYDKFYNFPTCEIIYLIDSTGSMSSYLSQTKNKCIDISKKLMEHYKKINFKFGAVFYKDPVDCIEDIHSFFPLTSNINQLQKSFDQVTASGGGDAPEDWVGAYDIILNKIKFTNSTTIVIHICDAPAHGNIFCDDNNYNTENEKLINIIKKFNEQNIKIIGFSIEDSAKRCFNVFKDYYNKYQGPLISISDFSHLNSERIIEAFDIIIFDMISLVLIVQDQVSIQIKEIRRQLKEGMKENSLTKENPINNLNEENKNLYELIVKLSY